jgi:hypothetical protein
MVDWSALLLAHRLAQNLGKHLEYRSAGLLAQNSALVMVCMMAGALAAA